MRYSLDELHHRAGFSPIFFYKFDRFFQNKTMDSITNLMDAYFIDFTGTIIDVDKIIVFLGK